MVGAAVADLSSAASEETSRRDRKRAPKRYGACSRTAASFGRRFRLSTLFPRGRDGRGLDLRRDPERATRRPSRQTLMITSETNTRHAGRMRSARDFTINAPVLRTSKTSRCFDRRRHRGPSGPAAGPRLGDPELRFREEPGADAPRREFAGRLGIRHREPHAGGDPSRHRNDLERRRRRWWVTRGRAPATAPAATRRRHAVMYELGLSSC